MTSYELSEVAERAGIGTAELRRLGGAGDHHSEDIGPVELQGVTGSVVLHAATWRT